MKKMMAGVGVAALIGCLGTVVFAKNTATKVPGEAKFKELCAMCHPNGGNIVNPKKTLTKKDRETNKILTEADIVQNMRKPGPGMTKFNEKMLSDKDATEIAKYIIMTFK